MHDWPVLIVEDLPGMQARLVQASEQAFAGHPILCAGRLDEAQALLPNHAIHAALIDIGLPDGSGISLVRHIAQTRPETPCVIVTMFDDDEHLFGALQAGAQGYLLKDQALPELTLQLQRIEQGEPPLSPTVARRLLRHFAQDAPAVETSTPLALGQTLDPSTSDTPVKPSQLTSRERDVLALVAKGFSKREVAERLGVSPYTVGGYLKDVYRKLAVSSRAEAALAARELGLA